MMVSTLLIVQLLSMGILLTQGTAGEKILLFPITCLFNSRTMNLEKIAIHLQEHGHSVTMLVSDMYKPRIDISGVELITYKMPETWVNKGGVLDLNSTLYYIEKNPFPLIMELDKLDYMIIDALFSGDIAQRLKDAGFSLFFFDLSNTGSGYMLNHYLNIPSIAYNNMGFFESWFFFNQPYFPSFTPFTMSGYSDTMTFWERLQNTDLIIESEDWSKVKAGLVDQVRLKYFPNENWPSCIHTFQRVSLVIAANVNFAFDYPRPLMPHVKPISGLLWTPPKPLPKFYEDLMASATHGAILLSFGTLVPTFDGEKAEILAKVLARFPQMVIWRYQGTPPKSLGRNTHLVEWFPQNDLLAHPATKLFITHCGISSTWETMYHAVPVVAIPLAWDQHFHAKKLKDRVKMGEIVRFSSLSETTLGDAVEKILNDRTYKDNAVKMSQILKDSPMSGQEELLYWINYVIRHNGTLHFHSQPAYDLNWYEYLSLDVIAYKIASKCLGYLMYLVIGILIWKALKVMLNSFKPDKSKVH